MTSSAKYWGLALVGAGALTVVGIRLLAMTRALAQIARERSDSDVGLLLGFVWIVFGIAVAAYLYCLGGRT